MPDGIRSIDARVALPGVPNQVFCEDRIELGPGSSYETVYVPSAEERSGRHPAFAGLLRDPDTGVPFPGGVIPANRLGGVYAWRIGPLRPVSLGSSASGKATVAPDSLATIYGVNLSSSASAGFCVAQSFRTSAAISRACARFPASAQSVDAFMPGNGSGKRNQTSS